MSRSPHRPGANLNLAEGSRNMRRIIAEDPHWSLAIVPSLSNLCLQSIVRNFEGMLLFLVPLLYTLLHTHLMYK